MKKHGIAREFTGGQNSPGSTNSKRGDVDFTVPVGQTVLSLKTH